MSRSAKSGRGKPSAADNLAGLKTWAARAISEGVRADLERKARWVESMVGRLEQPSTPPSLAGLTVDDLRGIAAELRKGAR